MTTAEIERAILNLPPGEARDLLTRLGLLLRNPSQSRPLTDADISRWQGKFKLPVGKTVDEYLRIVRHGDSD